MGCCVCHWPEKHDEAASCFYPAGLDCSFCHMTCTSCPVCCPSCFCPCCLREMVVTEDEKREGSVIITSLKRVQQEQVATEEKLEAPPKGWWDRDDKNEVKGETSMGSEEIPRGTLTRK